MESEWLLPQLISGEGTGWEKGRGRKSKRGRGREREGGRAKEWERRVEQQRVCVCEREAEGSRRQSSGLPGADTVTSQHKHAAFQL